jgi:hypothetical protein
MERAEMTAFRVNSAAKKRLNVEEAVFIMDSIVRVPSYCPRVSA